MSKLRRGRRARGTRVARAAMLVIAVATAARGQQGAITTPGNEVALDGIQAIAAANTEKRNGVFVADVAGRIFFHAAGAPVEKRTEIDALIPRRGRIRPLGMAYGEPYLYVFDGASRQIWAIDVWSTGEERPLRFRAELERPSHFAVSPHGLVAVLDGGRLLFLQEDRDPIVYDRSRFPNPSGLAFSSFDTLHVLDSARGSLVTIGFHRYEKSGELKFLSEQESLAEAPSGSWRAMDVYEGVVYLADENDVYAGIEAELVPVLPSVGDFDRIRDIALTRDGLYLKDDSDLVLVPRATPVEFVMEDTPAESQAALVELYRYLADRQLLRTRRVTPRRSFELDTFLVEEGVLIVPADHSAPDIRVYQDEQKWAYQSARPEGKGGPRKTGGKPQGAAGAWSQVFCQLGDALCSGPVPGAVAAGTEVRVPDIEIERSISREQIVLERPLESYLDELVPSKELRGLIEPAFLRRLNPELAHLSDAELMRHDRGVVTMPVERWSLTVAVPAVDYQNRESALWSLQRRHPGVAIHSRAGFVALTAKSMPEPGGQPDDELQDAACQTLRTELERWWGHIRYPVVASTGELIRPLIRPQLGSSQVRVGVLERGNSVLGSHQVFSLDRERPTWHTFDVLTELVPIPDPQTFEVSEQVALDVATFSSEAHHGTHVSALIAGRRGRCWSGLLPSSRLVLVDLTDRHRVARGVANAVNEEVRVFNVSQAFEEPLNDLRDTVLNEGRALWVVAAGNQGLDLNTLDEGSVPAPARWGAEPNVVTVTASDWTGNIIEDVQTAEGLVHGANRGKRYVDLVAPGKEVLSATDQKKYGPASGTSQATPQVAAAAGMLVDRLGQRLLPGDAKARLIATADWTNAYEGKVWGGRLDFGAAVLFPERNVLRTTTDAQLGRLHSVEVVGDPKIEIQNAPTYYERGAERGDIAPATLHFSRILSLRRRPDGSFRVVLREPRTDALKILLNARLGHTRGLLGAEQRIPCAAFEVLDEASGTFAADSGCEDGLSIETIDTYVQGGDYQIRWEG